MVLRRHRTVPSVSPRRSAPTPVHARTARGAPGDRIRRGVPKQPQAHAAVGGVRARRQRPPDGSALPQDRCHAPYPSRPPAQAACATASFRSRPPPAPHCCREPAWYWFDHPSFLSFGEIRRHISQLGRQERAPPTPTSCTAGTVPIAWSHRGDLAWPRNTAPKLSGSIAC